MSNQAKDWQKGFYSVEVSGNTVMVGTIRYEKMKGPYGYYLSDKKIIATAKCDPEDEFSLSMGVALAMDRLSKKLNKEIKVGDKVKIVTKDKCKIYPAYVNWVRKNVHNIEDVVKYAYHSIPLIENTTFEVVAIAPHDLENDKNLAYIRDIDSLELPCYLINVDGLEKV